MWRRAGEGKHDVTDFSSGKIANEQDDVVSRQTSVRYKGIFIRCQSESVHKLSDFIRVRSRSPESRLLSGEELEAMRVMF